MPVNRGAPWHHNGVFRLQVGFEGRSETEARPLLAGVNGVDHSIQDWRPYGNCDFFLSLRCRAGCRLGLRPARRCHEHR